ncbi:polysaccharide biosynthesis/export family protein [Algoriphagus machipongonensis]|uniref:Polysaccharide export protein, BexD/CtrA/VexA family n=1 Tax=Algoriphagus machipongonensis TaxID=388413 RepID=A3HRP6_9BACT|nr:polysaccharide biosynthesis/export family protein [Algoriphagus machipongonensis]EAZ82514.1 putative polysaccharide export protein, BexD/CtrA/VexA family [Algoriphagus machipongonensis]
MRRFLLRVLPIVALVFAASCISNEKIIYLQNLEDNPVIEDGELITYEIPEYKLQYNDIVDVNIQTVEDMEQFGFNNKPTQMNPQMGNVSAQSGGDIYYMTGFTVDQKGNVRLPIVGEVNVEDLTLDEARVEIEAKLREYVKSELFVKVKLGGVRYSALGEFRRPGKYTVLQDRMTIFEAIANAGDLTTVAKRSDVLLIRQYPEGTRIHRIDLLDRQIVQSPFYFIQPNDQIYVEPMKVRETGTGENTAQTLALVFAGISSVALILNLLK